MLLSELYRPGPYGPLRTPKNLHNPKNLIGTLRNRKNAKKQNLKEPKIFYFFRRIFSIPNNYVDNPKWQFDVKVKF